MRLDVKKTYKLFIGGAFPRSESGRSYVVNDSKGNFVANPSQASRKDLRDAVVAAKNAHPQWSSATAYNRGQILYRIAEIMEGRTEQFVAEIVALEGVTPKAALSQVQEAIDTWVWYAGWTDKISSTAGSLFLQAAILRFSLQVRNDHCLESLWLSVLPPLMFPLEL